MRKKPKTPKARIEMLSRVADALFWMSRYLERGEHVTRLLDVAFHLELDLRGVLAEPGELHWRSLAAILQQPLPEVTNGGLPGAMSAALTFDLANPSSILTCVTRSRANARSIRGTITSEMWRELNKLYWQMSDPIFRETARDSPHEFYQTVESGSCTFQGVCDATLNHDEGWQFIQLGRFLERADKTLRILDVESRRLAALDPADLPLSNVQWAGVLRACRAYEPYQRLYVGRVEPERVVGFLLLHPTFPRSVRFSLEAAAQALVTVAGGAAGGGLGRADRLLGRVLSDLKFVEPEQLVRDDLHDFLGTVLDRCVQVSRAVQEHYSPQ
jgi:uncharacterized alpha-E superfamily protein